MGEELNPYAAPRSQVLADNADDVRLRQEYLPTESHLKACGLLYIYVSILAIMAQVVLWHLLSRELGMSFKPWLEIAVGSLPLITGLGLYWIKRWAGILAGFLAVLAFGVGCAHMPAGIIEILIQGPFLLFLLSTKTRRILSRDYQRLIRRTPTIKSHAAAWIRPVIVIIALVVILFCVSR